MSFYSVYENDKSGIIVQVIVTQVVHEPAGH